MAAAGGGGGVCVGGGVAGWGYPAVGEKVNALKMTAVFEGGATQEILLKNGVEIADYRGRADVTGSKGLPSQADTERLRRSK